MKILFLVYHGLSEYSGISKKIRYQVQGLQDNGHEVFLCTYDFDKDGDRVRKINDLIIENYGRGTFAAFRKRICYGSILKYIKEKQIECVYARSFHNANPWTIQLFSSIKAMNVLSVIEIPTYPYDQEYKGVGLNWKIELFVDKLFRHILSKQTNRLVTFTEDNYIFGQKTIKISNGINFDQIKIKNGSNYAIKNNQAIHLIGVADVHYWHGYDRLIEGLGLYYAQNPKRDVYFHIVGNIWDTLLYGCEQAQGFIPLMEKYKIEDKIIMHGSLYGDELDRIFDRCDFAIGSLGRHRSGIHSIKTLKNREYAARGFSFIYSETDSDFDSRAYILKASADESPIQINEMLEFIEKHSFHPKEIRESIKDLSWKEQMKKVIDEVLIIKKQ